MNDTPASKRRFGCLHVLLFVGIAVAVTVVACVLVVKLVFFPSAFRPVKLNAREESRLQLKIERLDFDTRPPAAAPRGPLVPEAYSETAADRTIRFTQREINALLAKNTDLADRVAIHLSRDLVSAKVLIPVDADFPVLGGKTLRVSAGASFKYADGVEDVRVEDGQISITLKR